MVVDIVGISKSYEGRKVLDRLSLRIKNDEIVTIQGRSGAGKTTLLLCILGFEKPESGKVVIDGEDVSDFPIEQRQLAYVPQDYGLFPHLSVRDNISFGLAVRKESVLVQQKKVRELLDLVRLPANISDRKVTMLSGGEKQRVALARALAIKPRLFLLDEPLSAIDVETKVSVGKEMRALIKKLKIPTIVISHELVDARIVGDTIYELKSKRLRKVWKRSR